MSIKQSSAQRELAGLTKSKTPVKDNIYKGVFYMSTEHSLVQSKIVSVKWVIEIYKEHKNWHKKNTFPTNRRLVISSPQVR